MLVDLFIAVMIIAFILTILTVYNNSIVFCFIGLMVWLVLMGQSLWITDVAGTTYNEYGVSALTLAFVFTHVILAFVYFLDLTAQKKMASGKV